MPPRDSINRERNGGARREWAETLAIAALGFLASDQERLERFLALSGLSPETLRAAAEAPGFFAGVLEYLLADESLFHVFCAHADESPADVVTAHAMLTRSA